MRATLAVLALLLAAPATAGAATTTIGFDDLAVGVTVSNQYAGDGVVFGPLPGSAGTGFQPKIEAAGAGVAFSGTQVGSLANCVGSGNDCEFYTPNTTGTFNAPKTSVSVRVGLLGPAAPANCTPQQDITYCSYTTLTAYDAGGNVVGTPVSATLQQGSGINTKLEITTADPVIIGFRVDQRQSIDTGKQLAIDDLTFELREDAPPPAPDFSLTPGTTLLNVTEGQTATTPITIGRFTGSTGDIDLSVSGMPAGVTATLDPDPAPGSASTLTVTAQPGVAASTNNLPVLAISGAPSAFAGQTTRTTSVSLQVKRAFTLLTPATAQLNPCSVDIPITVARGDGFTAPVALALAGSGPGMHATLTGTTLTVTGDATGAPVGPATYTITGSSPGLPDRSTAVTVSGARPAIYDARITSMQITQGVQTPFLPVRSATNPTGVFRYSDLATPAHLRRLAPTIVRVYANLVSGPAGGVKNIPMILSGTGRQSNGVTFSFPGSPIVPLTGTRTLTAGPDTPTLAEQQSETLVYTFQLPYSWLEFGNGLNLKAELLPTTQPSQNVKVTPCTDAACTANDQMSINQIPFSTVPTRVIRPVRMFETGQADLPDPLSVFTYTGLVWPVPFRVEPYYGAIDITDISNGNGSDKTSAVNDRLEDWMCDHKLPDSGWIVGIHLNRNGIGGLTRYDAWCVAPPRTSVSIAQVRFNRPLTSVAHETGHLLGRPHASPGCDGGANGQTAEAWPPDEIGLTQSVGLDARAGSGVAGGPFALMSSPGTGDWFDPMSYCANTGSVTDLIAGPKTLDAWASVKNWNKVFEDVSRRRVAPVTARQTGTPVPVLAVTGFASGASGTISKVAPMDAVPTTGGQSVYHLVGFDAAGAQVADIPMHEALDHIDGEVAPTPLTAAIPAAGVVRVAIVRDGVVTAERTRSASAPKVSVRVPKAGARQATISWTQSDADGDTLQAAVSYAADGKHFQRIWMGPASPAKVPARFLSRAPRARIQVTVNDGFRATTVTSKPFRARGAVPEVRITNPLPGARTSGDATLVLTGEAFDDSGAVLKGRALTWRADGTVIGHGESIAASGLPSGTQRVTLSAKDAAGRTGSASVRLRLTRAAPFLTLLQAPKSIAAKAKRVKLRVAASQPAKLKVAGQSFEIGAKAQKVRVKVPRGAVNLTLRIKSAGGATTRKLVITRK